MNHHYQRILQGFKDWLLLLHYRSGSVKTVGSRIAEALAYWSSSGIRSITAVDAEAVERFYRYLTTRQSRNDQALLSNTTLNGYISSLQLLSRYLQETEQAFLEVDLPLEEWDTPERDILTLSEIASLYRATDESPYRFRDRVVLGLYYGCGLRSNEGLQLDMSDVLLAQRMVYVRKGKGNKERYVPFTDKVYKDLKDYMVHSRPGLLKQGEEAAFLIGNTGKRMGYGRLLKVLKQLQQQSGHTSLQNRRIGLHHLRHSIATHLLQQGMELEDISYFLGHRSVSSTQIYTHIASILHHQ